MRKVTETKTREYGGDGRLLKETVAWVEETDGEYLAAPGKPYTFYEELRRTENMKLRLARSGGFG